MQGRYVGYVAGGDPLHGFLRRILHERMHVPETGPAFRAFRLSGSNEVYAYEEKFSGARMIVKFYGPRFGWDQDRAAWMASQEYRNLQTLRRYGLAGEPHHVIRPLGFERALGSALAVEYYEGEEFSSAIGRTISGDDDAHLFSRLTSLGFFLATQHNRTADGAGVDFDRECRYYESVVTRLRHAGMGEWDASELLWLRDRWRDREAMWSDRQVWLHGDATPANFLFGGGLHVGAIDLERMKRGDRAFDVGRVTGELQHAFMAATGDPYRAEPFIGHFLWEYSCHFPDRDRTFEAITRRTPYYMGLNLLRIAANDYIEEGYRGRLLDHAKQLLRAG